MYLWCKLLFTACTPLATPETIHFITLLRIVRVLTRCGFPCVVISLSEPKAPSRRARIDDPRIQVRFRIADRPETAPRRPSERELHIVYWQLWHGRPQRIVDPERRERAHDAQYAGRDQKSESDTV